MDFEITAQIDQALVPLAVALYLNVLIDWSIRSTIQGVLSCGISVLGNQIYKQAQLGVHESGVQKKK